MSPAPFAVPPWSDHVLEFLQRFCRTGNHTILMPQHTCAETNGSTQTSELYRSSHHTIGSLLRCVLTIAIEEDGIKPRQIAVSVPSEWSSRGHMRRAGDRGWSRLTHDLAGAAMGKMNLESVKETRQTGPDELRRSQRP